MQSRQSIRRSAASGYHGAIAAARKPSIQAALAMLEAGGNAVDAGVAAALVAGVIEPMETTLGGSGFMLVGLPEGPVHSVEFAPRAPRGARPDMYRIDETRQVERGLGISVVVGDANVQGAGAAGVPASLRGLLDAHVRFGRLPRATVMAPAIAAAHDGFEADAYYALEALGNLDALRADPGAGRLFLRAGLPPAVAHLGATTLGAAPLIRQTALGRTLEVISSKGVGAFHEGELAQALLATVRERGGLLDAADLAACQTWIGPARRLAFRDVEVWAPNSPCGALTQLQMLRIWECLHPANPPVPDDEARIREFAETSWHAFADRYHWLADPDFVPVPEQALLSTDYCAKIAGAIRARAVPPRAGRGDAAPWNHFAGLAAHDPWPFDPDARAAPVWRPTGATEAPAGTTHVSVIDGEGMAVSITHTAANHFGSKVVCERTGILLDAAMGWFNALAGAANSIAPGKRPLANMGPLLVTRGGQPVAALGAPGGRRIISAVVQVLLNLVERSMDAQAALEAPRIDASGSALLVSERLVEQPAMLGELAAISLAVGEQHEGFSYELARPVIAVRDATGRVQAAADPFSRGYALAR